MQPGGNPFFSGGLEKSASPTIRGHCSVPTSCWTGQVKCCAQSSTPGAPPFCLSSPFLSCLRNSSCLERAARGPPEGKGPCQQISSRGPQAAGWLLSPIPALEFKNLARISAEDVYLGAGAGTKEIWRAENTAWRPLAKRILKALRERRSAEARAILRGAAALWWRRAEVTAARGRRLAARGSAVQHPASEGP